MERKTALELLERGNARFELLEYFQQKTGKSVYSLFPEAAEKTFN